jgi:hypothetical protein
MTSKFLMTDTAVKLTLWHLQIPLFAERLFAYSVSEVYEMNGGMQARPHYSDYFLACVRVSLSSLSYDGRPDPKEKKDKIDKLHSLFKEGPNRTDPDNFINAVISREIFESMRSDDRHSSQHFGAWQQAPQPSSLVNIPAGIKLFYGDGFSRVQACKKRFPRKPKEHWWVVNLIDQGKFSATFRQISS